MLNFIAKKYLAAFWIFKELSYIGLDVTNILISHAAVLEN